MMGAASDPPGKWAMGAPAGAYQNQSTAITVTGVSGGNPYVHVTPAPATPPPGQTPMDTVLKVLGRCGKRLEDQTRRCSGTAGNIWHHLKTSPNLTDAAMARLAQETKVFAEGGHDKVFEQTFGMLPGEQLRKSFACYLSTSSGPVIGKLYLSTVRIAFSSDKPVSYLNPNGQPEWSYYKVVLPLEQMKAVNPSASTANPSERYIQVVATDNHEFWFMGFVSYDKALKYLQEASQYRTAHQFR